VKASVKFAAIAIALMGASAVAALRWNAGFLGWFAPSRTNHTIVVSGNIEAHESILSFKTIQSPIVELPFDEGQWVKAGTLLARVDDADYKQQVAIAQAALGVQQRQLATTQQNLVAAQKTVLSDEAELALKKIEFNRQQTLWNERIASTEALDQASTALKQSSAALERDHAFELVAERNIDLAQANIESATEALKMAQIVLGYTVVRAPFDGVILVRQAELGEVAMPGTPIVTLADLDHVWLRAYINETDIGKVRYGQPATITTDTYPGKKYRGRISFISSSAEFTPKSVETHAERVTLVYRIRIDIDNPTHELVPGMPADGEMVALPPGTS
jgi:HlyD family secretion protein